MIPIEKPFDLRSGQRFADRFVIEHPVTTGGPVEVYRARDLSTETVVALKILRAETPELTARFEHEIRVLSELQHPAIVTFVAHGYEDDAAWLAMEWLEGEDLGARLDRAPLGIEASLALAQRVASALGAAHARGVVHRDVKPSNVYLVNRDPLRAKVLDFGVARTRGPGRKLTRTGVIVGTPWYMAPEQVRGERTVDARADVFSLGAVLFECLTGHPVIEGDTIAEVLEAIVNDEFPTVRSLCPEVPEAVERLVSRLLARDPAERPADGAAATREIAALRVWLAGPLSRPAPQQTAPGDTGRYPSAPGRALEIATLDAHLANCTEERMAAVVLLLGPQGVGKTRLVEAYVERLVGLDEEPTILYGLADPARTSEPFALLRQLVSGGADTREKTIEASFMARLQSEAATRTVVIVLEDIHWADAPSLRVIDTALKARFDLPWMVIATARPELADFHPLLWRDRNCQTLRLHAR